MKSLHVRSFVSIPYMKTFLHVASLPIIALVALCSIAANAQTLTPLPLQMPSEASRLPPASSCTLTVPESPEWRGLKLGMTAKEIRSVLPTLEIHEPGKLGQSYAYYNRLSTYVSGKKSQEMLAGVSSLKVELLDDRLTAIRIGYDNSTEWGNVRELADKISEGLGISKAWDYEQGYKGTMPCSGFTITVAVISKTGSFEIEQTGIDEIVEKRRQEAKEKRRTVFKP